MPKLASSTSEETSLEKVKRLGLIKTASPTENDLPSMPIQMALLTSAELSNTMSEFAAWREYVESLYIESMMEHKKFATKFDYELAKRKLAVENEHKKSKTREYKALLIDTDGSIFADREMLDELSLYKEALSIRLDSLTNSINVLSREITRRQTTNER